MTPFTSSLQIFVGVWLSILCTLQFTTVYLHSSPLPPLFSLCKTATDQSIDLRKKKNNVTLLKHANKGRKRRKMNYSSLF